VLRETAVLSQVAGFLAQDGSSRSTPAQARSELDQDFASSGFGARWR
jgi:hypothetical protein